MVKGRSDSMAILGGDATSGPLQTMYDGPRPPPASAGVKPGGGYQPMKKQGSIVLGVGGDNARDAIGIFYEGVMTKGLSTDTADGAVQANIISAGYSAAGLTAIVDS
uniref:Alpha-L-arabinofuranosidase B catalytic domain-containing protein n=1 Tax=Haptolina ericina TaxID=156174 RepID=A0A7S3BSW1_9EUKA